MSKPLDRRHIISAIKPEKLELLGNKQESIISLPGLSAFVNDFSTKDFGRGMLNHDLFCLVEALFKCEDDLEEIFTAKVHTSKLDNLMLTLSLKAFLKSKKTRHKCNLAFFTPPFSYSFPLLLSYHLILQHVAESLSPELNAKFPAGTGILIISDNVELYSHIGRTSIQNNHLWHYINTYEVKANRFRPFSFSSDPKLKPKPDGTLPWISMFRAVRHQLPEKLDMIPQVIILDLLPFRHRSRASELLEWAKQFSQHVIVTAPLYDESLYQNIKGHLDLQIPLDAFTIQYLQEFFYLSEQRELDPITASWSLLSSQAYLLPKEKFDLYCIQGVASLIDLFEEIEHSLSLTTNKAGHQHPIFKRLKSFMNEMLSLPIPLEIYERARELNGKPKLIELIKNSLNVLPGGDEDRKLFEHLLPQLIRDITAFYELMYRHPSSPKGELLLQILPLEKHLQVTIVVANSFASQELKLWLRMQTKWTAKETENIRVVTQEQWAKSQLNEIYMDENSVPDHVILTSPWKLKYLSSFFTHAKSKVSCIAYAHEQNLYRYQINKVYSQNADYTQELIAGFSSIPKVDLSSVQPTTAKKPRIDIHEVKVKPIALTDSIESVPAASIESLFDEKVLLSMFGQQEDSDIEELDSNIIREYNDITFEETIIDDRTACVKITGKIHHQDSPVIWFVPVEALIKVVKDKTLTNLSALAVKPGDTWVLLKENQRRELFETILKLSSNTMVMKWIEFNVMEWRDMLELLWRQFHKPNSYKKHTYEKIRRAIQEHGGNVETTYTIANWINGDVSSVKNPNNVRAVAKIIGESSYLEKWNTIYNAMRRLWNIHIKLGRVLGAIISESAAKAVEDFASEWVDIGLDIKLPLDDIMASIELVEVLTVDTEQDYFVPYVYAEKPITEHMVDAMIEKGLITLE
ncbi:DrmE family protein [Gorillibacterium sp. CAU 1737]|uniref:DrmE family protein n=1 Tax=Gorillibacterium sp. CAU 1737 TaxID=3140362 RepID=UPI003261257B